MPRYRIPLKYYHLDMLDRRLSLAQNIDKLCPDVRAPLRDELPRLMEAKLSDSPLHRAILELLSQTKVGMHRTALARELDDNGSNLKRALDDLEKAVAFAATITLTSM